MYYKIIDRKFTLSLLFVDRPIASCARMSEKGALIATKSDRMASHHHFPRHHGSYFTYLMRRFGRKLNKYVRVRVFTRVSLGKVDESLLDVYVDVFVRGVIITIEMYRDKRKSFQLLRSISFE